MSQFDQYKTEIFTGVNDQPRPATAEEASNGSDIVNRVNGMCDQLNQSTIGSLYWGQTEFYVNDTSGNDDNDGLTESSQKKSFAAILELIKTKTIDKNIIIHFSNYHLIGIDLDGIKWQEGGSILFRKKEGYFTIEPPQDSGGRPIINYLYGLPIKILGAIFHCHEKQIFEYQNNLEISSCSFQALSDYTGEILEIIETTESKISGNTFIGDQANYYSYGLLNIRNSKDLKVAYNRFYYTNEYSISIENSTVALYNDNQVGFYENSKTTTQLTISDSSVTIDENSSFKAINTSINNSLVVNKSTASNVRETLYFSFDSLTDESRTLIINAQSTFSIKSMLFANNEDNSNIDVKINNNSLFQISSNSSTINYELNNSFNRVKADNGDSVSISVTGTATNLVLQLEILKF